MTPRERAVTNAHAGIELQPVMYVLMKNGKPLRARCRVEYSVSSGARMYG